MLGCETKAAGVAPVPCIPTASAGVEVVKSPQSSSSLPVAHLVSTTIKLGYGATEKPHLSPLVPRVLLVPLAAVSRMNRSWH